MRVLEATAADGIPHVAVAGLALLSVVALSALVLLCLQSSSKTEDAPIMPNSGGTTGAPNTGSGMAVPPSNIPAPPIGAPGAPPEPEPGNREQDPAVEELHRSVHTVCRERNGYLVVGKRIKPGSIRMTSKAVVLDVSTNYSIEETALFYADKKLHQRHMRMQTIMALPDFMPAVVNTYDESNHPGPNGWGVTCLPAAIFFQKATPLAQRLAELHTPTEQQQELFGVWQALAEVLQAYHQSGWFVRNISKENVVHVRRGTNAGWTLLEFGQAASRRSKVPHASIPARSVPPELANVMLQPSSTNIQLTAKYDMWQLGVMVYEVMTNQPYWAPDMKDSEVLNVMANPNMSLPHQQRPIPEPRVQAVIEKLLQRDPERRIDAASLKKSLVVDLGTLAEMTMNGGGLQGTSTVVEEMITLET